ncbi:hypothetical protein RB593_009174 [Gaeumannomyces tritici]
MMLTLLLFCVIALSHGGPGNDTSHVYHNAAYFVNWAIYSRNYQPHNLPDANLNRILYAFLNIKANGEVYSWDTYADLEKHYPTDSWNEPGHNAYGCVKQLYLLKKSHRHLKVILSIGGWTWSSNFPSAAATAASRERFANSAVKIMSDWGFDGIDIDWEYPTDQTQAADFVLLLRTVRNTLDVYAQKFAPDYHFALSIASPAGPTHYKKLNLKSMADTIDYFNLMAYDYAGSWDTVSAHQSNLYSSESAATPFSTAAAVEDYLRAGVPASKIVIGMPLYGRAFESTNGIGQPFSGVGGGSWENGVWDFKALPRPGATENVDFKTVASYSYDPKIRELITYDTPEVVEKKVSWLKSMMLAGSMFWEASSDRTDDKSLIRTSFTALGSMDTSPNLLSYPNSKFANIAAGIIT